MSQLSDHEIQDWIDKTFEENYEHLQLDGGHRLSNNIKKMALMQVKAYYKKLKHIAQNVTDVEIRLTLSNQLTLKERRFAIEGVVDLINEGNEANMYDIKTHEVDYISAHKDLYRDQLSIYKRIWEGINEKSLDGTMIISTALPGKLVQTLRNPNNFEALKQQIESWEPVVDIPTNEADINKTISEFASVVDQIEDGLFPPACTATLHEKLEGSNRNFASRVCRNCDVRFACDSYREFSLQVNNLNELDVLRFYNNDYVDDERDEFIEDNLGIKKE